MVFCRPEGRPTGDGVYVGRMVFCRPEGRPTGDGVCVVVWFFDGLKADLQVMGFV